MTLRTKLFGGFFTIALITVGAAAIGYWQTQKLAAALTQAGVVRLPSMQALDAIFEAQITLDDSKRELLREATVFENDSGTSEPAAKEPLVGSAGGPGTALTWAAWGDVLQEELQLQQQAWERAEKGWKTYEALRLTPEEEARGKDFVTSWNTWRTGYEKVMARLSRARATGDRSLLTIAREENYKHLFEPTRLSHQLLADLREGNEQAVTATKQQAGSSQQDVQRIGYFLLAAAAASVAAALGCGIFLGRLIRRPIGLMAGAFTQIARGDLNTRVAIGSRDELGQLAEIMNRTVESLRLGELRFRAVFEHFPAALSVAKKSHLVLANPALPALFGYDTTEAVIGRPVFDFIAPEDRAFLLDRIRLHDRDQTLAPVYELTGLRKDGTKFALEVQSAFFIFQGEKYTVEVLREITARKQAPGPQ